ncbi:MAG: tRNA uridine(34) 5-carboxymethylaminomethyl modification radical SAM/GNAT enzyme Elp3 [Candidatus Pacebacteria bacterium]|nr:tRNA uridine(34) 5-carboxymethylaminomethyl modification radical SAM/GNAT enzyme Elp3 [Candidatus Paceibacterota bacterium]
MDISESIIQELIMSRAKTLDGLARAKRKMARKNKISLPTNISLLKRYHELIKKEKIKKSNTLELLLRTRPIRSLSGIVNVSVLTKPYPCPGNCLYCPQELEIPKSYVSGEPAVERAKKLGFNPFLQVKKRIEMLKAEGHPTDKIELRIVGGTWSYYPKKYQEWFVKRCFEACNSKKSKARRSDLRSFQKQNEKAEHRIVGLSVETRPDFINKKEIDHLRKLGATLVELGVQSIYDDVLSLNKRGHGVKETIEATKLLKDAGFKVLYQIMPNLPGSNLKKDEAMFKELFSNPDFQPDLLKIYPCALLKEAPLYKFWREGKYMPYSEKELTELLKKIKKNIPCYVRIQRITRDIPSHLIVAGPARISNLRQVLIASMKKENWSCKCIRCREIKGEYDHKERVFFLRQDYQASQGREIFLSFENKNRTKIYSLLRLRKTSGSKAFIREVHTYGQLIPLRKDFDLSSSPQHRGFGKKLIKEAEKIAKKEFKAKELSVISGAGVRGYYRKLGYKLRDTYMVKKI